MAKSAGVRKPCKGCSEKRALAKRVAELGELLEVEHNENRRLRAENVDLRTAFNLDEDLSNVQEEDTIPAPAPFQQKATRRAQANDLGDESESLVQPSGSRAVRGREHGGLLLSYASHSPRDPRVAGNEVFRYGTHRSHRR